MTTPWRSGPPQQPGLFVLDLGSASKQRYAVIAIPPPVEGQEMPTIKRYVRAHLFIPEPPQLQPIKITIPLQQAPKPFNLAEFLHDHPEATLDQLTEAMNNRGTPELEIPPELEGHPLVRAALHALTGREVSLFDLQAQPASPWQPPQPGPSTASQASPQGFRPGQMVEVQQDGAWHRAIYVHHMPNGHHIARINNNWQVEVGDPDIRKPTPH